MGANTQGHIVGTDVFAQPLFADAAGHSYEPPHDPRWDINEAAVGINERDEVIGYGYFKHDGNTPMERGWVSGWPWKFHGPPTVGLRVSRTHDPRALAWLFLLAGVTAGGGGVGITYHGKKIPIDPRGPGMGAEKGDVITSLAFSELASMFNNPELRQVAERAAVELLQKATKIATGGSE